MQTPTREEFLFMAAWQKAAFYLVMAISLAVMAWQLWQRIRIWKQGKPIDWKPDYIGGILTFVLAQKKVRSSRPKSGAPMHLMIFYGFLALFIATTLLGINTYSPWKFHQGNYYLTYEFIADIMGLVFVVGISWAIIRRQFFVPKSLTSAPPDFAALYLFLAIGLTGFLVEAARMSANPKPFDTSAPIGNWLSEYMQNITPSSYIAIWWFHVALVAGFFMVLPQLRIKHIAYAIFSAAGTNPEHKMGELQPIRIEEVEQTGQIGVALAKDYSRWHLMSLDACMECGRCTEVCPAWGVGKSLNPKEVVQNIRMSARNGSSVAEAVTDEALWACTTCNACVEACPVLIKHVDLIVDARRNLVAEGKLTGTGATMLRQMQSTENAWGAPASEREKWMEGEDIPLARDLFSKNEKFEVLLWVGCAGATDPSGIKTTKNLAALLKKAGVSFACLGKEERCTGDAARRLGDEFLYQQMAESNIATFEQYGVKTIVTACPHCFSTIKNEYPQFKGNYEVLHHSQLLGNLVSSGKLKSPNFNDGEITIHDPCYLARINKETDAQRIALGANSDLNQMETPVGQWLNQSMESGNRIVEPEHRGQKTLCCGAGGGRMWMDEEPNQRPAIRRCKELVDTGAKTIAVACPFCRIMLDTGMQAADPTNEVKLLDIAELLHAANHD